MLTFNVFLFVSVTKLFPAALSYVKFYSVKISRQFLQQKTRQKNHLLFKRRQPFFFLFLPQLPQDRLSESAEDSLGQCLN